MHVPADALTAGVLLAALIVTALYSRVLGRGLAAGIALCMLIGYGIIGNLTLPLTLCAVGGLLTWRSSLGRATPSGRDFIVQVTVLFVGWAAYTTTRHLIEGDQSTATDNAIWIIDFERSLGLYFEPALQEFVLRSSNTIRLFNWLYSFAYLAFIAGGLVWLWGTDTRSYHVLRNSLGVCVLPALLTFALLPVAPPRLVPEADMIDTITAFGRSRTFSNDYAAMPSLHVGWMAITGVALSLSVKSRWRYAVALGPVSLMMLTVMVTGNHYWLDGVVGVAYASVAMLIVMRPREVASAGRSVAFGAGRAVVTAIMAVLSLLYMIATTPRMAFTTIGLGALWTYMLGMQIIDPGFTDFWGYLFAQVTVIGIALIALEIIFRKEGGLSPATHVVAVAACFADVIGTDGNLYAKIDEYDKLTHFVGVAVVTAAVYDVMRCLNVRGTLSWTAGERLMAAVLAGIVMGVGWEVYEFLGDKVFHTGRVQSRWDTGNDIVSDTLGALSVGVLLWFSEVSDWRDRAFPRPTHAGDAALYRRDDDA